MTTPIWTHKDANLSSNAARGLERALRGEWLGSGQSALDTEREVDELRALLAWSAYDIARLIGSATITNVRDYEGLHVEMGCVVDYGEPTSPDGAPASPGSDRMSAALVLGATWSVLAAPHSNAELYQSFTTQARPETTGPPAAVVVAVVIVTGVAVAYLGHRTLETVDRQLARNDRNRAMLQKHAEVERLVDEHLEREAAAGKQLPLSEPVRIALGQLGELQRQATPSPVPNQEPASTGGSEWTILAWAAGLAALVFAAPPLLKALKG